MKGFSTHSKYYFMKYLDFTSTKVSLFYIQVLAIPQGLHYTCITSTSRSIYRPMYCGLVEVKQCYVKMLSKHKYPGN